MTGRKPHTNAPNPRQQRKAVTLGNFLPKDGIASKGDEGRKQQLTLDLGGADSTVSARVPRWSDRDRLTETPTALRITDPLISSRKRRRRIFAGLRGIVSNHIPTCALRPYRNRSTSHQTHSHGSTAIRPPRSIGRPPCAPQYTPPVARTPVFKRAQQPAPTPQNARLAPSSSHASPQRIKATAPHKAPRDPRSPPMVPEPLAQLQPG